MAGVGTGVGTGVGLGVGLGVGFGVGFGVGVGVGVGTGVGATTTTIDGDTVVKVAVTSPAPVPLVAMKRYACVPAGRVRLLAYVAPAGEAGSPTTYERSKVPAPSTVTVIEDGVQALLSW
jgi:hypothetical protein